MSDLISRKEAIKKLYQYAEIKHTNGEIELANGILKAKCFIENKENVPNTYDVDKVENSLEEVCFSANDYPGFVVDIEQAVDIVRKGGINESD